MTDMVDERRRFPRQTYQAPLHYREATLYPGQGQDLSESGMTFEASQRLRVGTPLELFLVDKNVQIDGVVQNTTQLSQGGYRIGVHFEKPTPELVHVLTAAWNARHD